MPRIARSALPLYQTRGDPVRWPTTLTDDAGVALDLTGASAVAVLAWAGAARALSVAPLDATGKPTITGPASATADLPLGQVNELQLAVTDSQGTIYRFVWPVDGETP